MALKCHKEDFAPPAEGTTSSRTLGEPKSHPSLEYPSEWFAAHPGSKPIVLVKRCYTSDEHLARAVSAGLASGSLPVEYVVQFMHIEGAKIKDTLTEDWKSFGVTIGCAGQTISPWDLLNVAEKVGPANLTDAATMSNADSSPNRAAMFALVVCIYRLLVAKCHGGRYAYLQRLRDNLKRILERYNSNAGYLMRAEKKFGHWLKDMAYLSLIAALDMFFHHFHRHDMADLRAGTLVSRYKHCTVIDDISRLCNETGLYAAEFFQWVFVKRAAVEVDAILREGQELFDEQSYAPYLTDLGLCRRSPYSADANPLIHYFCNATAALMGSWRSQKSRITSDVDLSAVTLNAMLFAYAKTRCGYNCFVKEGDYVCMTSQENVPREFGQMPRAFIAAQWYEYLSEKSFTIDPEISRHFLYLMGAHVRAGTVGAKLVELVQK